MANEVKFIDNSVQVKSALKGAIEAYLAEAGGEIVAVTVRNTPVDTGHLRDSWRYEIDMSENKCTIGSPLENAIFNEFGTGEHALNHDGRKGGWYIPEEKLSANAKAKMKNNRTKIKGKIYYFTKGKKPQRSLYKAFTSSKGPLKRRAAEVLKAEMK